MSDETAPYRALLAALGIPPMMGAESDEAPEDKPTDETPDAGQVSETTDPPDVDQLQKSYQELRREFTQRSQEWSEERKAAEQHRLVVEAASNPNHPQHEEALEYLGLEPGEAEEEEYLDEEEALAKKVEDLEAKLSQREEQEQLQAIEEAETDWLAEQIESLQDSEGREFNDKELRLLVSAATGNRLSDGQPDIEGAFQLLKEFGTELQKTWKSSKKAPRQPGQGTAASRKLDLQNRADRVQYATEVAEAAMHAD